MLDAVAPPDAFTLRHGVVMPAWSFVTDPTARKALAASMVVAGWPQKWSGLSAAEDRVWQAVLLAFARSGQAPNPHQLSTATDIHDLTVISVLHELRARDLVVLDACGSAVTAAYPFCSWVTGHRVRLGEQATIHSLCAIDALGTGAMLGCDTVVESTCHGCGAPIRIETRDRGHVLGHVAPDAAVVWSGVKYAGGCAATSGCTSKVFFCSDEHLTASDKGAGLEGVGFRLSVNAAMQVGKALFVPMLAEPLSHAGGGRS